MSFVGSNLTYGLHGEGLTGTGGYGNVINDYFRLKILFDEIIEQLQPPKKEYVNANFDNFVNIHLPNQQHYQLKTYFDYCLFFLPYYIWCG